MSESSDGGKMAANRALKRCPHCNKELEIDSRFCNRCGKPQKEDLPDPEIYCVNPACKIKLFTPSAQICHKCHTSQKPADDKMNHELKTQQHNLETTEQHKAEVKNAVESIGKEGDTQQKSKDTIKNRQNPPASQGSSPCSSIDAHDIPAEQPQPESRTPPKHPKSITAATADSEYQKENTGRATLVHPSGGAALPQQSQAPSGGATLPQQSQVPSGRATLPQQSQVPTGGATIPQQSQVPTGGATIPQQSQVPSGRATLPQQSQVPTGGATIPQQSQVPTGGATIPQQSQVPTGGATIPQQSQVPSGRATLPQQSQVPTSGATIPQQSQVPTGGATIPQQSQDPSGRATLPQQQQLPSSSAPFPQQQQLPSSSAPFPQQQQLPRSSAPFPQQQQLPSSSAPFPQQQHPPEVPPVPPKPKSFPPASTTPPTPAESGSSVDKLQVGNDDNHFSTDPPGRQSPIQNPSKPTRKEDDHDQAPDVAKGQGNSEQSSTQNQAINTLPKTANDTELLSQQAWNSQSASEAITKVSLMCLCHKKSPTFLYGLFIIKGLMNT